MKYAFFGTPEFAAIILERLIAAQLLPAIVVCNPDRPVGRKKIITPPPTKEIALTHRIPVEQPEKLTSYQLPATSCQFAIVAAYAKIIPQSVIDMFPRGIIGVHPSLLPKHRGPSPIQSSILAGDKETGVTLFMIDKEVDHGKIVASSKYQVERDENYVTLSKKLAEIGAQLLIEMLPTFAAGEIIPKEQDHTQATFTKKFTAEDGFVEPEALLKAQSEGSDIAIEIDRKIRALNPEPGVWTYANGLTNGYMRINPEKRVKLLEAKIVDGKLVLKKIQIEGKAHHTLL